MSTSDFDFPISRFLPARRELLNLLSWLLATFNVETSHLGLPEGVTITVTVMASEQDESHGMEQSLSVESTKMRRACRWAWQSWPLVPG
jgi:hypothetical protein